MNDLLAVTVAPPVAPVESAPKSRPTETQGNNEPRSAFEDTPALAKLREEQRADKNRRDDSEENQCAAPCDSAAEPSTAPAKTEKHEGAEVDSGKPDAEHAVRSKGKAAEDQTDGSKQGAAAELAGTTARTAVGQAQSSQSVNKATASKETPSPTRVGSVSPQESSQAKDAVVADSKAKTTVSADVQGKAGDTSVALDDSAAAKKAAANGSQAAVAEGKDHPAATDKSHRNQETTSAVSKRAMPETAASKAEQTSEHTGSQKITTGVVKDTGQKSGAGDASASVSHSVAKTGAGETANGAVVAEAKAERDATASRQSKHHAGAQQAAGVKTGAEQTAAMSGQAKDSQLSGSGDGLKEQADVSVSASSDSTTFAGRLASQEGGTPLPEAATPKGTAQSVSEQILDSVRASVAAGDKQVTVRLDPPELGAVTVKFQEQGDQVRAVMEVSRPDTRQEVERAMPELLRTLHDAGVQIRRVEVVLADQSGRDFNKDHFSQQDAWASQQNPQQQADNSGHSGPAGWKNPSSTTYANATTQEGDAQNSASVGRINMLM